MSLSKLQVGDKVLYSSPFGGIRYATVVKVCEEEYSGDIMSQWNKLIIKTKWLGLLMMVKRWKVHKLGVEEL